MAVSWKSLLAHGALAVAIVAAPLALGCRPGAFADPNAPAPKNAESADRETWDILAIRGVRVGCQHTAIRTFDNAGRRTIRVEQTTHMAIERFGEATVQDLSCSCTETPQGRLLDFRSEIRQGPTPLRSIGKVCGDRLEVRTTTMGKEIAASIPLPPDCGGFCAVEESLLRAPMQPGQRRTVNALDIGNQVVQTELTAGRRQPVKLLGGEFELLPIAAVMRMPDGQTMQITLWADRCGEMLKSRLEAMGLETFRATKELALAPAGPARLDLGLDTLAPLDGRLLRGHETQRARYRVVLDGGEPVAVFVNGPSQWVRSIGPHAAEVTVWAIRPGREDGNHDAPADPPTAAQREPNNFIQSDDARIVADAKEAADAESDPWKTAVALERFVHRAVTKKDYREAFATAADVARSHEGDCKAHAVYLAALARARGIPARVAIGLVYLEARNAFGFHMWTEVYIGGRWIPLDGTLGQGGIGAAHLKLGQSALEGVSAYSSFLPVGQVVGKLKIKLIEAE